MTDTTGAQGPAPSTDTAFLGHPRGLAVLFFAEMWERFSYYGMRAMLVTYLVWHYLNTEDHAYGIYGAYAGMIYLAPVLGGYLADRYLGARKAVTFGAILITLGHFTMAYEGAPPVERITADGETYEISRIENPEGRNPQFIRTIEIDGTEHRIKRIADADGAAREQHTITFRSAGDETASITGTLTRTRDLFGQNMTFLALALIIVGTGFLKANISTIVGSLYAQGDPRRDSGFTIFYFGINAGAFLGQMAVAFLAIKYGWAYGFGLAGIGMLFGLLTFLRWQYLLEGRADPPDPQGLKARVLLLNREWIIYLGAIAAVGLAWLIVRYLGQYSLLDLLTFAGVAVKATEVIGEFTLFDVAVNFTFIACILGILIYSITRLAAEDRDRMIVLLVLTISSTVFWTLFDQAPTSLVIFQTKFVDTWIFNAQQIGSANPIFILMFAPVFTVIWQALGRRGREPAVPFKFSLGLFQIGLGYFVLNAAIHLDGGDFTIGIFWILLMYLLHTTGELCLSPIGLSAVTKLSVRHLVGFMMGIWFMAVALAQVFAALVAKQTVVPEGTERAVALAQYNTVYLWLGIAAIGAGALMFLASPLLKRMMHGRL